MKKQGLCFVLACLLVVSLAIPARASYADVPSDAWYASDVNDMESYGIITGVSRDRFDPTGTLTLAQAITMAARTHAYLKGRTIEQEGVPWFQPYVDYAEKNSLYKEGEFGKKYGAPCSRLTMALLFARVFPQSSAEKLNDVTALPDLENNSKNGPVFFLYQQGVLTGNDAKGTFNPDKSISRAETTAILNRVLNKDKRKTFTLQAEAEEPQEQQLLSAIDAYEAFLKNKEYKDDTKKWLRSPRYYTYQDIDQNGIEELIIIENNTPESRHLDAAIYGYNSEDGLVFAIPIVPSDQKAFDYYYISYSSQYKALVFTTWYYGWHDDYFQLKPHELRYLFGVDWMDKPDLSDSPVTLEFKRLP